MKLADYKVTQDPSEEGPPRPETAQSDVYGLVIHGHITRAIHLADALWKHYIDNHDEDSNRNAMIVLGMGHALSGVLFYKHRSKR